MWIRYIEKVVASKVNGKFLTTFQRISSVFAVKFCINIDIFVCHFICIAINGTHRKETRTILIINWYRIMPECFRQPKWTMQTIYERNVKYNYTNNTNLVCVQQKQPPQTDQIWYRNFIIRIWFQCFDDIIWYQMMISYTTKLYTV